MHLLYVVFLWSVLSLVASFRTWDNFWNEDPYIAKLVSLENNSHYPIIIIGDSVIRTNFPEDKDQRWIDQMLSDALGKEVLNLGWGGTPITVHKHVLDFLIQKNITTDLLVLELNSLQILRKEEGYHRKLNCIVSDTRIFMQLLHHIFFLDKELLLQKPQDPEPFPLDVACALSRLFIDKERLERLPLVIEKTASLGAQVADQMLCFVTPINITALNTQAKVPLQVEPPPIMDAIASTCKKLPVIFINLYDALPRSSYFLDKSNCHLNDKGRQFVVDEIVKKNNNHSSHTK